MGPQCMGVQPDPKGGQGGLSWSHREGTASTTCVAKGGDTHTHTHWAYLLSRLLGGGGRASYEIAWVLEEEPVEGRRDRKAQGKQSTVDAGQPS